MKLHSTTSAQRKEPPCKPTDGPSANRSPKRPKYRFHEGADGELYAIAVPQVRGPTVRAAFPAGTARSPQLKLSMRGADIDQEAADVHLPNNLSSKAIASMAPLIAADAETSQAPFQPHSQPQHRVERELPAQGVCTNITEKIAADLQETNQLLRQIVGLLERPSEKVTQRHAKPKAVVVKKEPAEVPSTHLGKQLLSKHEVCSRVEVKPSTLYAWIAQGKFPKPLKLSAKMSRWDLDEVAAWIATRRQCPAAMSTGRAKTSA